MNAALSIVHDPALMVLSILIVVFASYTAMDLYKHVPSAHGAARGSWLMASALAMASGVWSMYFTGLLSMELGMSVGYLVSGTLVSFFLMFVAAGFSFHWLSVEKSTLKRVGLSGLVLSGGVAAIQLLGLQAIEVNADLERSWPVFTVAALFASISITGGLWLATRPAFPLQKLAIALLMAIAVSGLHYFDTMSLAVVPMEKVESGQSVVLTPQLLAVVLAFSAGTILSLVLISAVFDRRLSHSESQALRDSEERFRIMAEALPIAMAMTRVEDRQVLYSNQRSIELFKVPSDPAKREPASKRYVDPKDRENVAQAVAREGFIESYETKMRKYDGTEFWVLISARRARSSDGDMIISGYYDISDRKAVEEELEHKEEALRVTNAELEQAVRDLNKHAEQLEEALRLAREADQATRAKSTFLATMSHEIRTPMNGILGLLELHAESDLDAEQAKTVKTINESAKAMLTLIDDILDFSKIEAGKLDIEQAELKVIKMIEAVGMMAILNARKKDLAVLVFIDPDIPRTIIGDEARLRQILNNLISNSLKFTDAGDVRIHATLENRQGSTVWLRLDVEDTGIGIAEEHLGRLFEPFSQAELSTTRRYGGTGLGLAITQRLVNLLGGTIEVESKQGEGSTFTVRIPVQVPASQDNIETDAGRFKDHFSVIVSTSARKPILANRYLSWLGFETAIAPSVARAQPLLTKAQSDSPMLAIVSSDQTGGDVSALIKNLRSRFDGEALKILVVVSDSDEAEQVDANLLNGVKLIAKPVLHTSFMNSVKSLMIGDIHDVETPDTSMDGVMVEGQHETRAMTREEALAAGRLILVAEDHETNRMVIKRQLNRLGYAVDVVANGVEALSAIQNIDYGLLLTDCHMPEMDGMELTASVRALSAADKANMPIVAITANALSGEADRCIAAGMNDYLSKPVSLDQLSKTLGRWLSTEARSSDGRNTNLSGQTASQEVESGDDTEIDVSVLADLVGGDESTVRNLLQSFVSNAKKSYDDLREGVQNEDVELTESAAHKLSGSAKTAGAVSIVATIEQLRQEVGGANWQAAAGSMRALNDAIERADSFVERL